MEGAKDGQQAPVGSTAVIGNTAINSTQYNAPVDQRTENTNYIQETNYSFFGKSGMCFAAHKNHFVYKQLLKPVC